MNKKTYDLSLLVGTLLVSAGATASWGIATGLMVAGGLVLALTVFGAVFLQAKG